MYLLTCKPVDVTNYDRPYFGEPLLVPFYTSLKADISKTRIFFPVFPVLSYQKIQNFHFMSTLKRGDNIIISILIGVLLKAEQIDRHKG